MAVCVRHSVWQCNGAGVKTSESGWIFIQARSKIMLGETLNDHIALSVERAPLLCTWSWSAESLFGVMPTGRGRSGIAVLRGNPALACPV